MNASRTTLSRSRAARLVAFGAWCAFLVRTLHVFAPGSSNVDFNSDSAIPVLMSADKAPVTLFNVYYYGQDRFGGWPFLVARLFRHFTGFQWTPASVFVLHACWVFSGSLVLAALSKRNAWLVAVCYLSLLCLPTSAHFLLLRINQPYGWQTTALLLAWLGLRGVFESFVDGAPASARGRAGWLFLAFGCAFLAVSSATTSAPFLVALLALEVARGHWKHPTAHARRNLLRPGLLGLAAVAGGIIAERLQQAALLRYAMSHFGRDNATNDIALDWGFFATNVAEAWHIIAKLFWWPLHVLPAVAMAAFVAASVYARVRRRGELEERLRAVLADDTAVIVIGGYLVAAGNFAIVVLVSHVRNNDYDERYLTPTNLFAPLCGLLTLLLVAKFFIRRASVLRRAELGFVAVVTLTLTLAFPARGSDERYLEHQRTALALARRAPDGFLLGSYWDTYVFSALEPAHTLTPVTFEGETNRMPWSVEWLRGADSVIVVFSRDSDRASMPPLTLREYGLRLVLTDPSFYADSEYVFARYRIIAPDRTLPRGAGRGSRR